MIKSKFLCIFAVVALLTFFVGADIVNAIQNGPSVPHIKVRRKLAPTKTKSYVAEPHEIKTQVKYCAEDDYACQNEVFSESVSNARAKRKSSIRDKKANNGNKKIKQIKYRRLY